MAAIIHKGQSQDCQQDTHPVLKSIPPLETKLNKTEAQTKMAAIILKGQSQDCQQDTHPVLKSIPPLETKLNKTESQTKMAAIILEVGVLDGKSQEVQDALVLGSTPHMLAHFVPVVFVHFQRLQQQQGLLVSPLTCPNGRILVLEWRKEGNVLFNDVLNTFYLRLYGVGHMVNDHSDSERRKKGNVLFNDALNTFYLRLYGHSDSEKGNMLPPHRLLFPINSKGSFICTIPQTG